jgi:hypothetical protein
MEPGTSAHDTSRLADSESFSERLRTAAVRHPLLFALAFTLIIFVFVLLLLWWITDFAPLNNWFDSFPRGYVCQRFWG